MAIDNTIPVLGPVTVWTIDAQATSLGNTAEVSQFPWNWNWKRQPMLNAYGNRFTKRPGAMGSGSFTILRDARQEPNDTRIRNYNSTLVAGQYVCITADSTSVDPSKSYLGLDPAKILWFGWISALDYEQVTGTLDGIGTATALEVGHLLDQQQIANWRQASDDGNYGDTISSPPTANIGDSSGAIIGNATSVGSIDGNGTPGFAFSRLPKDCGVLARNFFTRWRLLWHVVNGCIAGAIPPLTIVTADNNQPLDPSDTTTIAGWLNDTSTPEVFDLRNLTFKGAIDMCAPQTRGFNWTIELRDTKGWTIVVYSYAVQHGPGGIPFNPAASVPAYSDGTGTNVGDDPLITNVRVISDSGTMPDEIWIEGSPIVFGNTVSFADGNLVEGWQRGASNQEDQYRQAAQGASDYSTLDPSVRLERNAMVRTGPGLCDVYTRYQLDAGTGGNVRARSTTPGDGSGGDIPLCSTVTWNSTSKTVTLGGANRCPYLPTASFLRILPWEEGVASNGTDQRPTTTKYLPQYLRPKLFRYDKDDTVYKWLDLESRNGRQGFPPTHLDVDDRGAAFRVVLSTPEYLAKNHWTDAAGGTTTPAMSEISPEGGELQSNYAIDYTKLVATVAIESDQRVLVTMYRPGITAQKQVRRRLVLRDPNLHCWIMRLGTIIGLKKDGTPDRVTGAGVATGFVNITGADGANDGGAVMIRNDFPTAQARANMAASWVFRQRNAIRVQRADPTSPPSWVKIGFLINKIIEQQPSRIHDGQTALTVNTVIEEVTFDFSAQPRLTFSTAMPGMIGFPPMGGKGGGPSSGGGISVGLSGTLGQAIQTQQQVSNDLSRATERVPLVVPRGYPRNSVFTVKIDQGNTLTDGSKGIKFVSPALTSLSSQYDPNTTTSFQDGIGRGTLYVDGAAQAGYVLVINDGRGGISGFDLLGDTIADTCVVGAPISMPTTGSNVLVYAPITL